MAEPLIEDLPSALEIELRETLQPNEKVLLKIQGAFKQGLVCTDRRVMVLKSGFMTGNTFGTNMLQLPYRNITSVEVKFGFTGFFELSSGGVQNTPKSYWTNKGPGDAKRAPNTISLVSREQAEKFRRAADFILNRVNAPAASPMPPDGGHGLSVADEIAKLAGLLKDGYLTQTEFDDQKRAILSVAPSRFDPAPPPAMDAPEPEERSELDIAMDRAIAEGLRNRTAREGDSGDVIRPGPTTFGKRRA